MEECGKRRKQRKTSETTENVGNNGKHWKQRKALETTENVGNNGKCQKTTENIGNVGIGTGGNMVHDRSGTIRSVAARYTGSEPDYDAITETDSVLLGNPFLMLGRLWPRRSRMESPSTESGN